MRIISLDPGLSNIGFAFFQRKELIQYGAVKSKGETLPDKLAYIVNNMPEPPFQLERAVIELAPAFAYGRNSKNGKSLIQGSMNKVFMATGALAAYFAIKSVPVEFVLVNTWKGKQGKETTQDSAERLYKAKVNDHIADAIMLGHFFLSMNNIYRMVRP